MKYFDIDESAFNHTKVHDTDVLELIANQFISNNHQEDYTYRVEFTTGIICNTEGEYLFDFSKRFPTAVTGQTCFAAGKFYSYTARQARFKIKCYGTTSCKVNEEFVFVSCPSDENYGASKVFEVLLQKGWNTFRFATEKTEIGFGFEFGNTMPQWEPSHFRAPYFEWEGQSGFVYSLPVWECEFPDDYRDLEWLPRQEYETVTESPFDRIFGINRAGIYFAKTNIKVSDRDKIVLKGNQTGKIKLFLDTKEIFRGSNSTYCVEIELSRGIHTLIIEYEKAAVKDNFSCILEANESKLTLCPPVKGYTDKWLYLGPFTSSLPAINDLISMNKVYQSVDSQIYWACDKPNAVVRIFAEQELFGRWTYPMGVTLYGFLEAGAYLKRQNWIDYVKEGVELITEVQEYALYDKKIFGYPGVNTQLCWLDALDDCGSFGSLMLEVQSSVSDTNTAIPKIADKVADYMLNHQRREPDGAFSRGDDTMWIDDMYMSIPFLCRYYNLSGEIKYLEEAVKQVLLYKQYFYLEDQQLMSHIYSVRYQKANKIPWSRGNGWVLFSLSELLKVFPASHDLWQRVIEFYNQMVEGVLAVQGDSGLWNQVLDEPTTYLESSGTAMFICAFSRGIRGGYIKDSLKKQAVSSVDLAWTGLTRTAIDRYGNLYGVCQGSGCSFSRNYYQNLSWRFNDPHGIGIVMLAGTEKMKLDTFISE